MCTKANVGYVRALNKMPFSQRHINSHNSFFTFSPGLQKTSKQTRRGLRNFLKSIFLLTHIYKLKNFLSFTKPVHLTASSLCSSLCTEIKQELKHGARCQRVFQDNIIAFNLHLSAEL